MQFFQKSAMQQIYTQYLNASAKNIAEAAQMLHSGELVAFPTETVYGLGACAFNDAAVRGIFTAKGRPSDNPLIVHCAGTQDLLRVADISQKEVFSEEQKQIFEALCTRFCPGPLTFVLPKRQDVPDSVTAGLATVAVRFPKHPVALALIEATGEPLVAPSANRSGYPSPTTAAHVLHDLKGRIHAVLDGGACEVGIESTVVNILAYPPRILRPGSISKEQLNEVVREVGYEEFIDNTSTLKGVVPQSPGMKYRHYAPLARVLLVESVEEASFLAARYPTHRIFAHASEAVSEKIFALSEQNLYAELRAADDDGIQAVIIVCSPKLRMNAALMNRLTKAAEG
jgi:L-threonylcarbamoyladenylate synthase